MSEQVQTLPLSRPKMRVRAVLRSDVGLVRTENQDFGSLTTPEEERSSQGQLLIVADGMGGHRGGATASRLAGETVKQEYLASASDDVLSTLRQALLSANARIFTESQANADLRGMGTTTSVLAIANGGGWFAHVGDSRIYRIRQGEIEQLTDDHSLVASMVREGLLSAKEAETHPRRNVLQRSMGVSEEVEIDVKGPIALEEGDIFILCSDGLHGLVKEDELREVSQLPIDEAADEYLRLALSRGAPDNVTLIVARVEESTSDDLSQFDETLRDAPADESVASQQTELPHLGDTGAAADVPTPVRNSAKRGSRLLWWVVFAAIAVAAAGAWYWSARPQDSRIQSQTLTR